MLYDIFRNFAHMKLAQYTLIASLFVVSSLEAGSSVLANDGKKELSADRRLIASDDEKEKKLIDFARKLLGVKYKYAATSPSQGFDCSGFVYYVFNKFGVHLPRSSSAIGQSGDAVSLSNAKAGDIILFTGTNPAKRSIGHVGIIVSNDVDKGLRFIHASSGKAQAVTETMLEGSYKRRFMKVVRVI